MHIGFIRLRSRDLYPTTESVQFDIDISMHLISTRDLDRYCTKRKINLSKAISAKKQVDLRFTLNVVCSSISSVSSVIYYTTWYSQSVGIARKRIPTAPESHAKKDTVPSIQFLVFRRAPRKKKNFNKPIQYNRVLSTSGIIPLVTLH